MARRAEQLSLCVACFGVAVVPAAVGAHARGFVRLVAFVVIDGVYSDAALILLPWSIEHGVGIGQQLVVIGHFPRWNFWNCLCVFFCGTS